MGYRRIAKTAAALLAATALVLGLAGTANAAGAHYPVPYTFAAGITAELAHPNGSPPGANDWSCRPSAAHPEPVVLTHGLLGNRQDNWQTFAPLLANNGYCVFALTYGNHTALPFPVDQVGGLLPMQHSAHQLADFVNRVRHVTGAAKVDIVGHSEGTLMPEYYVKFLGGAATVDKYVSLAPLWHGTALGGAAMLQRLAGAFGFGELAPGVLGPLCGSCTQFLAHSPFLRKLRAGGVYAQQVTYTNIVTRYDELVVPYTSGIEKAPNATNIVVQDQCDRDYSDHLAIAADPVAAADVLGALDPAHPREVPCVFVPPFVG